MQSLMSGHLARTIPCRGTRSFVGPQAYVVFIRAASRSILPESIPAFKPYARTAFRAPLKNHTNTLLRCRSNAANLSSQSHCKIAHIVLRVLARSPLSTLTIIVTHSCSSKWYHRHPPRDPSLLPTHALFLPRDPRRK
jgi:hypothetical protein